MNLIINGDDTLEIYKRVEAITKNYNFQEKINLQEDHEESDFIQALYSINMFNRVKIIIVTKIICG